MKRNIQTRKRSALRLGIETIRTLRSDRMIAVLGGGEADGQIPAVGTSRDEFGLTAC